MPYDKQLLKGTVSIMVLTVLRENDMYGYQIIKELEQRSDNVFSLNEGALYPILHKLETDAYISSYWEESEQGRKRKYYHLTSKGVSLYENKIREWQTFSKSVNMVLGGLRYAKMCV